MQSVRQHCHPGHRRRIVLGGLETRSGGTGFSDQPTDLGKGGIAGPTSEDGTRTQARAVEDSRSPQVDRTP